MAADPRFALCAVLAVAAMCLVAVSHARAETLDWSDASDIVASPDGRHVYAAGSNTLGFRVDQASGALELIGHSEPGGTFHPRIAMARQGRFVYVSDGWDTNRAHSIHVMSRDPETGLLTHEGTFRGREDIGSVASLSASADGTQLYAGQHFPGKLAVYDTHAETGALMERQVLFAEELPSQANDIAPSPDGRHVYLASDRPGVLARDPDTGTLRAAGTGDTDHWSAGHRAIALSPDGLRAYSAVTNVDTWRRDPGTGALQASSHDQRPTDQHTCHGACGDGWFVSVAPDGRTVFTSAEVERRVLQWRVTDTGVAFERQYTDGEEGVDGLANPMAMTWSPDGRFAFVAASQYQTEHYISSSGRNGTVAAFRRGGSGLELVNVVGPGIPVADRCKPGASSLPGISIEDGDLYTNSPEVTVTIGCPVGSSLRLSNVEGDFSTSRTLRAFGSETRFPWRLDTSGAQRDVKRVHVRWTSGWPDMFDDIILDQRPPQVLAARLRGDRLRLAARDNRSGVKRLQITTSKTRPGKARRFTKTAKVSGKPRRLLVRVFDGAGNGSAWKVARRP